MLVPILLQNSVRNGVALKKRGGYNPPLFLGCYSYSEASAFSTSTPTVIAPMATPAVSVTVRLTCD